MSNCPTRENNFRPLCTGMAGMRSGEGVCGESTNPRGRRIRSRMSYIVIKTINGRQYYYEQTARYLNGKRTPLMRYIGPVSPKRRRGIKPGDILRALFEVGGHVAANGTNRPNYKAPNRAPDPRSMRHMLDRERQRWERCIDDAKAGYGKPEAKAEQDAGVARLRREARSQGSPPGRAGCARTRERGEG